MSRRGSTIGREIAAIALGCSLTVVAASAQVHVVNVIPLSLSGETAANPEPMIAVNPMKPAQMVIAVIVPGDEFCAPGGRSPLFISEDRGNTWTYACVIPRRPGDTEPFDVAFRYGPDGVLYAAHLATLDSLTLRIIGSTNPIGPEPMIIRFEQTLVDQPWIEVVGVRGTMSVIVSGNDKRLMTVDSVKGTGALFLSRGLKFTMRTIEHRNITGQNYAIRLAGHSDGTLYAIYYSPRGQDGSQLDVVVARDDSAGRSAEVLGALRDLTRDGRPSPGSRCTERDGRVGFRIARCRAVPFEVNHDSLFGQERRVAANLSIAVDPRNSRTVYVAWADSTDSSHYTLHVRQSRDGGQRWSDELMVVHDATNPALAVDVTGTVGFGYQQLQGSGDSTRWVTRLVLTDDAFATTRGFTLANVPARSPLAFMFPYIGDYMQLVAVGTTFYGTFSAANRPDKRDFPNGVVYQRRADFTKHVLLGLNGEPLRGVTIDPFFYRVGKAENAKCPSLRAAARGALPPAVAARARMGEIGCRTGAGRTRGN
jgi:hypothetical protein